MDVIVAVRPEWKSSVRRTDPSDMYVMLRRGLAMKMGYRVTSEDVSMVPSADIVSPPGERLQPANILSISSAGV